MSRRRSPPACARSPSSTQRSRWSSGHSPSRCSPPRAAIEEVYRARYRSFLRLGYGLLGNADEARDAVQETFAIALRASDTFRGEGSLEGWLWKTMLNVCRQEQRLRGRFSDEKPPEQTTNGHPQRWPELRALVAALPERERYATDLRYFADLSQDEIAEVLGVRPGTVGAALNHGRNRLCVALTPEVTQ
jgi:RNA polymerase sigma factor (sigma-70 family)